MSMTLFNEELGKLPGVITQVEQDYSTGFDQSAFGTTDSVLIVGTAFNGPVGTPTPVYSMEHARYIFGEPYQSETLKEASLVAGIQDAWNRGCRTIYGVRIGGKNISKTFDFAVDSDFKLQLSSQFPSNIAKDCYVLFDATNGDEKITFYKPASRATIVEKQRGVVESGEMMIKNELRLNQDYSITSNSRLVDLIDLFNRYIFNNVLNFTIIDKEGNDVTHSAEANHLKVGSMLSGLYTIGRDESLCDRRTTLTFHVTKSEKNLPYKVAEPYFRRLKYNTDVSKPYPIVFPTNDPKAFRAALRDVQVTTKGWEFLETYGAIDRAFKPDAFDYEETDLSKFEIYKRLGSGYAITARAEQRKNSAGQEITPRIIESPVEDKARTVSIKEGIYSVLEDSEIKYRAIVCAFADDTIKGKLPRASEFKKASPLEFSIMDKLITVTPIVDQKDFTKAKKYSVTLEKVEQNMITDIDAIAAEEIYDVYPAYSLGYDETRKAVKNGVYKAGSVVFDTNSNKLARLTENGLEYLDTVQHCAANYDTNAITSSAFVGRIIVVNDQLKQAKPSASNAKKYVFEDMTDVTGTTMDTKDYALVNNLDTIFLCKINGAKLIPVGDLDSLYRPDEDEQAVSAYVESSEFNDVNRVVINSGIFDHMTLEEFVEELNKLNCLRNVFTFGISEDGALVKDDMVAEILNLNPASPTEEKALGTCGANKEVGYDYTMRIPFRTTDNFARQLAQHCTYTELKTTPTHGVIGTKRMASTSLDKISMMVDKLIATNFDLYAKNAVGRNMLDRNNLPYNIGRNVSVVVAQSALPIDNASYTYVSNNVGAYAGFVSTLDLDQSSTMQAINVNNLEYALSKSQLSRLTSAGFVTMRNSFTKGIVVTDGVTMANADSIYRRLSCSRVVGAVEDLIRQAAEPFIGKQNHTANRNALKTAIKSKLDKITGTLIEKYDFVMNNDPKLLKMSVIEIDYQIVPVYEIREIRNTIKMVDSIDSAGSDK